MASKTTKIHPELAAAMFKTIAAELAPEHPELQTIGYGTKSQDLDSIADFHFRTHGEYLGGMAVIIAKVAATKI